VIINARDTVAFDGVGSNGEFSGAFSNVGGTGIGDGGDINITTGSLRVSNSAQLVAITEGQGNGGKIIVRANTLEAVNGGQVTVSSEGSGIAGTLIVEADAIRLDNKATFSADTSGGGGNINLSTGDLILRRGSSISTNATGSNITGGNITINTDNLVAVPKEDSDISANATESFGGRVIVNATGIFGTQFRPQDTPLSDITASSELGLQFNGVVQLNTPGIDPSRGLANLPTEVVDASNQIDQTCSARGGEVGKNEFIVTGRGGLPPNPSDPLNSDAVWIDLDSTTKLAENRPSSSVATQQTNSTPVQLVEATGWVINDKGQVVLTASAPTAIPYSPGLTISQCHVP
jgi:large exoprotein involved in heme utilization and adhesion